MSHEAGQFDGLTFALLLLLLSVAVRLLDAPGAYLPASMRGGSAPPDGAVRT